MYAKDGECELNPDWMLVNCQLSCQSCNMGRTGPPHNTSVYAQASTDDSIALTSTPSTTSVPMSSMLPCKCDPFLSKSIKILSQKEGHD